MRPRARVVWLSLVASGLVGLLNAPVASALTENPCVLVSKAKLGKVLGLEHVTEKIRLGQHCPAESDGMDKAECQVLAWNGAAPTSFAGALQKLASGNGAELIIQTFQTDPGPDAHKWVDKGYERQLHSVFGAGYQALVKLGHGHVFGPPHDGAKASIGYTGSHGHGRQAIGVWFDDSQHAFMQINLTMAQSKPVISLVDGLAKTAVPAFFRSPRGPRSPGPPLHTPSVSFLTLAATDSSVTSLLLGNKAEASVISGVPALSLYLARRFRFGPRIDSERSERVEIVNRFAEPANDRQRRFVVLHPGAGRRHGRS